MFMAFKVSVFYWFIYTLVFKEPYDNLLFC